ncbi:MAG: hypothetical protein KJ607_14390 [Bacteroidetes bacterium]|nr:hypothetical protein [Bacteroidota bacterium]
MRIITLLIVLITVQNAIAQSSGAARIDFDDLIMYEFKVLNIPGAERARYMDKLITGMENVYFCNITYQDASGIILCDPAYDINEANTKLGEFSYSIVGSVKSPFDEEVFYNAYINIKNFGQKKSLKDKPEHARTGYALKDQLCFDKAMDIWRKNNPDVTQQKNSVK